jgi:Tfp pilus assembly protein PilF
MKSAIPSAAALLLFTAVLAACAPVQPPASSVMQLATQPAEQALLAGVRFYEEAQYLPAERELRHALEFRLKSPLDTATAWKYLAFITCTSDRVAECEKAFMAARSAHPAFALTKAEAGHPQWGPVYRRMMESVSESRH